MGPRVRTNLFFLVIRLFYLRAALKVTKQGWVKFVDNSLLCFLCVRESI